MRTQKQKWVCTLVAMMVLIMATAGLALAAESITGTIAEKGEIMVLDTADGSYILEGSDMTPDMVGKKVTVTGTVAEKDNMRVINVLTMEEIAD